MQEDEEGSSLFTYALTVMLLLVGSVVILQAVRSRMRDSTRVERIQEDLRVGEVDIERLRIRRELKAAQMANRNTSRLAQAGSLRSCRDELQLVERRRDALVTECASLTKDVKSLTDAIEAYRVRRGVGGVN